MEPGNSREEGGQNDTAPVSIDTIFTKIYGILDTEPRKFSGTISNQARSLIQQVQIDHQKLTKRIEQLELAQEVAKKKQQQQQQTPVVPTYSAVLAGTNVNKPPIDPLCTLQVFPKTSTQTGESTSSSSLATKQILEYIDLSKINVGVKGVKHIRGHGVSVLCRSKDEAERLKNEINNTQNDKFTTSTPKKKNPSFSMLITGTGREMEKVKKDIFSKNDFLKGHESELKIVHHFTTKNSNTIVIFEVSPLVYQSVINNNSELYIGWSRVSLREQCPTSQCFNCFRFGHKAKNCNYKVNDQKASRCAKCSKGHAPESSCTEPLCCPNCTDYNLLATRRHMNTHPTNHSAKDESCPCRVQAIKRARAYINYV